MYFSRTCWSTRLVVFVALMLSLINVAMQQLLQEVSLDLRNPPPYKTFLGLTGVTTIYQCMEVCWAYKLCKSLYYKKQTRECKLLTVSQYDPGVYRQPSSSVVLLRTMLPQVVTGSCWNHNCGINERCLSREDGYTCVQHGLSTVRCPPTSGREGDTCVWLVFSNTTRNQAKGMCDHGGSLLEINNPDFDDFVRRVVYFLCGSLRDICYPIKFWFGLEYSDDMAALVWSSSGTKLLSTDFHKFQSFPSSIANGQCVGMERVVEGGSPLQWTLMDCEDKNLVLCYSVNAIHWT